MPQTISRAVIENDREELAACQLEQALLLVDQQLQVLDQMRAMQRPTKEAEATLEILYVLLKRCMQRYDAVKLSTRR